MEYPKINSVQVLENYILRVVFKNSDVRIYDCKPLLNKDEFKLLNNGTFFKKVKVDAGGYGIIWNDDIDLAESELWINGVDELPGVAENKEKYGD